MTAVLPLARPASGEEPADAVARLVSAQVMDAELIAAPPAGQGRAGERGGSAAPGSRPGRTRRPGPRSARLRALHQGVASTRAARSGSGAAAVPADPGRAGLRDDADVGFGARRSQSAASAQRADDGAALMRLWLAQQPTGWSTARVVDRRAAAAPEPRVRSAASAPGVDRPARPAGAPAADRAPLRLTRRGAAVGIGLAAAVLIGVFAIARASAPADPAPPASAPAVVTVEDGDTLWSIAAAVAPQRDPRAVVADLRRINGLDSVDLQPGQLIRTR